MSPIREQASKEAYEEYPIIQEDVNGVERNGYIGGYHAALDNVSIELERILSISTKDSLENNIRIFIKELDNVLDTTKDELSL